jgi:hypothetical protein
VRPRGPAVERAVLVALVAAGAALSNGDAIGTGERKVDVAFDVLVTEAGGPTRRAGGLRSAHLSPNGGTGRVYLSASPGGTGEACHGAEVAVGLAPPPQAPGDGPAWAVEARVGEVYPEGASLDVRWSRLGAAPSAVDGAWDRVVLEHGQRVLLDFVSGPASESACARNLALEVSVRRSEPPGLEDRTVGYEVWMLHVEEGRLLRSRTFRSSVAQGEAADFRFPPERLEAAVDVSLQGDVRGWVRPDGQIDVVVSARRTLALEDGSGAFAESGRLSATVSPGEAVRVVLPEAQPRPGEDPRRARAVAGHSFALLLVARPEP